MIIYLDTETTGLYPGNICQLSYIIDSGNDVTVKNFFFTVDYVEPSAYAVHGFSTGDLMLLSKGKRFSAFSDEILSDFNVAEKIVCHNTQFDFMFLSKEFESVGKDFPRDKAYCSMKKSIDICKLPRTNGLGYKYPKLSELCEFYGITDNEIGKTCARLFNEKVSFHDARFDTTGMYLAVKRGIMLGHYKELVKG